MRADVQVTAKTLQNKFYLFQLTPAAETTLQYTDGKGVPKTVTTNSEGVLALYEPNGIASEVSLRSGSGADIYLGTIYKENLRSGERDATKLQLYPLNTFSLRRVARASVTLITPGGDPLANKTAAFIKTEATARQLCWAPEQEHLSAASPATPIPRMRREI